ncbi:MAG: hypothetical protein K9M84_11210 [Spirochaetia bacterium]|nr:hypothetical protein [Spirochaetia bacterium]
MKQHLTDKNHQEREMLLEIARLYYMEERSQAQIAQRFDISRSLVSKLLKRARNEHLVTISLQKPRERHHRHASAIIDRFGMRDVLIEPNAETPGDTQDLAQRVGSRAARYLESVLKPDMSIGIEWGTSLYHMIDQVSPDASYSGISVVQLHGVIDAASLDIEGFTLVRTLGQRLKASVHVMQAPMMVQDVSLCERLTSEEKIARTIRAAQQVDVACIGIGTNSSGVNVLTRAGYLTGEESMSIREAGGTAMISGWFIDRFGDLIDIPANKRIIGLHPHLFRKIPLVIAVAYGREKGEAVHAALRGGYVDVLITDAAAAEIIIQLMEEEQRTETGHEKGLSRAQAVEIYQRMHAVRSAELQIERLFAEGTMHGTTHLCIGQEASSVVPGMALQAEDVLFGTHRGHGQALGKGLSMVSFFAEMLGKRSGCASGIGGSMHLYDRQQGVMGMNGIVAGALPIAAGAALAIRQAREQRIAAVFLGDGAVNEGAFHESLNLAAIWKLPILFICENNQYGFSKRPSEVMVHDEITPRVLSYGITPVSVDGNDAIAVYHAVTAAREAALSGVPQFLILSTYRIAGHSKSDKNTYRSEQEIARWKELCPLDRMAASLVTDYGCSGEELAEIRHQAERMTSDALHEALSAEDAAYVLSDELVYASAAEGVRS